MNKKPVSLRLMRQTPANPLGPEARIINLLEQIQLLADSELNDAKLLAELTVLAKQCHIDQATIFAQQTLLMAKQAREQQRTNPDSNALQHAQTAAKALLLAQKKSRIRRHAPVYAAAASLFFITGVSAIMFNTSPAEAIPEPQVQVLFMESPPPTNPIRIAEMRSQREKMREGRCQFPEAIVFSETERGIYLQNVVHGEISANREVQDVTSRLREYVRCDYTPMLMKNSVS